MGDFSFLGQFTGKSRVAPRKIIQEKVSICLTYLYQG